MVVGMQRKSGLRTALAPVGAVWCGRRGQRRGREREASQGWLIGKSLLAYNATMSDVYRALADPTRRVILDELSERDGQTLFELCTRLTTRHGLGSSRQAISQHLDVLESAGLVRTRREGRYKFHQLDTTPLETILERWRPTRGRGSR